MLYNIRTTQRRRCLHRSRHYCMDFGHMTQKNSQSHSDHLSRDLGDFQVLRNRCRVSLQLYLKRSLDRKRLILSTYKSAIAGTKYLKASE